MGDVEGKDVQIEFRFSEVEKPQRRFLAYEIKERR